MDVDAHEYFESINPVVKAFVEVFAKETDDKDELKLREMTVIEIWDRIQRLTNTKFLSPIGLAQNFFLLTLTG